MIKSRNDLETFCATHNKAMNRDDDSPLCVCVQWNPKFQTHTANIRYANEIRSETNRAYFNAFAFMCRICVLPRALVWCTYTGCGAAGDGGC